MRKTPLAVLATAAILVPLFVVFAPASFSAANDYAVFDILSSSDNTIIKVSGEASQTVEPDQITLVLSLHTTPAPLNQTSAKSQEITKKTVSTIETALGPGQSKIQVGQSNINPHYSGAGAPADTVFTTYSTIQIKTDLDHYYDLSSKLTDAGFRVDGISIREVQIDSTKTITKKISLPSGSSSPSDGPYYIPEAAAVKTGTTVVWTNDDSAAHTVTSGNPENGPDGIFDSGLFMAGRTYEYTFYDTGEFEYFCLVHPWMTGKVVVVKGDSERPLQKETAYEVNLNVVIETQPADIKNAIRSYQERLEKLKQVIEESQLSSESIKSNQINFNQMYYGSPQYSSYSTYTRVTVSTDIKNTEKLLSAIKMPGVNVDTMLFSVSDATLDKARKVLTQRALDDAASKAGDIAEPSGLKIKSIKSVEINANPTHNQYANTVTHRGVFISPIYDSSLYSLDQLAVSVVAEFEIGK